MLPARRRRCQNLDEPSLTFGQTRSSQRKTLGDLVAPYIDENLTGRLQSTCSSTRAEAALTLGRLGLPITYKGYFTHLLYLLEDPNSRVRWSAVRAIGLLGMSAVSTHAQQIAKRLQDRNEFVCQEAVDVLGMLGDSAMPFVACGLRDEHWQAKWAAATLLARLSKTAVLPHLPDVSRLLGDQTPGVRAVAAQCLLRFSLAELPEQALALAITASHGNLQLLRRAREKVEAMDDAKRIPIMTSLLEHVDTGIGVKAASFLRTDDLLESLQHPNWRVRWVAVHAICLRGVHVVALHTKVLALRLQDESKIVCQEIVDTLATLADSALGYVVPYLEHEAWQTRWAATLVLSRLSTSAISSQILVLPKLLADANPDVSAAAALCVANVAMKAWPADLLGLAMLAAHGNLPLARRAEEFFLSLEVPERVAIIAPLVDHPNRNIAAKASLMLGVPLPAPLDPQPPPAENNDKETALTPPPGSENAEEQHVLTGLEPSELAVSQVKEVSGPPIGLDTIMAKLEELSRENKELRGELGELRTGLLPSKSQTKNQSTIESHESAVVMQMIGGACASSGSHSGAVNVDDTSEPSQSKINERAHDTAVLNKIFNAAEQGAPAVGAANPSKQAPSPGKSTCNEGKPDGAVSSGVPGPASVGRVPPESSEDGTKKQVSLPAPMATGPQIVKDDMASNAKSLPMGSLNKSVEQMNHDTSVLQNLFSSGQKDAAAPSKAGYGAKAQSPGETSKQTSEFPAQNADNSASHSNSQHTKLQSGDIKSAVTDLQKGTYASGGQSAGSTTPYVTPPPTLAPQIPVPPAPAPGSNAPVPPSESSPPPAPPAASSTKASPPAPKQAAAKSPVLTPSGDQPSTQHHDSSVIASLFSESVGPPESTVASFKENSKPPGPPSGSSQQSVSPLAPLKVAPPTAPNQAKMNSSAVLPPGNQPGKPQHDSPGTASASGLVPPPGPPAASLKESVKPPVPPGKSSPPPAPPTAPPTPPPAPNQAATKSPSVPPPGNQSGTQQHDSSVVASLLKGPPTLPGPPAASVKEGVKPPAPTGKPSPPPSVSPPAPKPPPAPTQTPAKSPTAPAPGNQPGSQQHDDSVAASLLSAPKASPEPAVASNQTNSKSPDTTNTPPPQSSPSPAPPPNLPPNPANVKPPAAPQSGNLPGIQQHDTSVVAALLSGPAPPPGPPAASLKESAKPPMPPSKSPPPPSQPAPPAPPPAPNQAAVTSSAVPVPGNQPSTQQQDSSVVASLLSGVAPPPGPPPASLKEGAKPPVAPGKPSPPPVQPPALSAPKPPPSTPSQAPVNLPKGPPPGN